VTSRHSHLAKLRALTEATADRVRERACLIFDGCPGVTWDEADDQAFEQEAHAQVSLFRGAP
jgi:hypothetical protein